jgi:hypothetical protein
MTANLPTLGTSERAAAKKCPAYWNWAYEEGLTPKGQQTDARWFGIGIHLALAKWYRKGTRRGPHPADTFEKWADEEEAFLRTFDDFDEPVWVDARDLGVAMLEGYVDHWGRDEQWEILAMEHPFNVRITDHGTPIAMFRSRYDGVFRDLADGRIYLDETKTAGQISLAYLEIDDQAGAYWAVADTLLRKQGILKPDEHIAGIQYNFLRKVMPDDRPVNEQGLTCNKPTKEHYVAALIGVDNWTEAELRKFKIDELDSIAAANHSLVLGEPSKNQPAPRFVRPSPVERSPREVATQLGKIRDEVRIMNAMRDGTIPILKKTTRDCPRCDMWAMCVAQERGGNAWKSIRDSAYDRVDRQTYEEYKSAHE